MEKHLAIRLASVGVLSLTGCASSPAAQDPTHEVTQELTASATVLGHEDGTSPVLCLGLVLESSPPLCSGPNVVGWDWANLVDAQRASGSIWGTYEVTGTWDGTALTLTSLPRPTRHESAGIADFEDGGAAATPALTAAIAHYRAESQSDTDILGVEEAGGSALVTVVFDDGAMQKDADALYGERVVVINSALKPVSRSEK
jgi:hypothetical protein